MAPKRILNLVAALLVIAGGVFFLQGLGLVPSRLMFGKPEWVVIGGLMVIAGIGIVVWRRRSAGR